MVEQIVDVVISDDIVKIPFEQWELIPRYRKLFDAGERYIQLLDLVNVGYHYAKVELIFPVGQPALPPCRVEQNFKTKTAYIFFNDRLVRTVRNCLDGDALRMAELVNGTSVIYGTKR
jgi:hypothetical protein